VISREVHFVEISNAGGVREAGGAPYLDYRPATADEIAQIRPLLDQDWLKGENLERRAAAYAVEHLVPRHLERVRARRLELIDKTEAAVQERLTKEINYWDSRAVELRAQEQAGIERKRSARTVHLNSQRAQERADRLAERLKQRKAQLAQERQISAAPPVVVGGALIVPAGLIYQGVTSELLDKRITEQIAMRAVMEAEIALGHHPRDVSSQNLGFDIESRDGRTGRLRFIEVKGRRADAETVTLTYNELYRALNSPDAFILALVEVEGSVARQPRYVRRYPFREPDPLAASVNFNLKELLSISEEPK
jgi:hypothetical protein